MKVLRQTERIHAGRIEAQVINAMRRKGVRLENRAAPFCCQHLDHREKIVPTFRCVETGEVFSTFGAASRVFKVSKASIANVFTRHNGVLYAHDGQGVYSDYTLELV